MKNEINILQIQDIAYIPIMLALVELHVIRTNVPSLYPSEHCHML